MRKRLNTTATPSGIPTDVSDTLNATKKKARECCIENAILTNIDYLQKQAITPSWEKPAWFVGGVLTGVVVFLGSAYALDKIGE